MAQDDLLRDNRELQEIIVKLTREKEELYNILCEIKFLVEHIDEDKESTS